MGRRERVRHAGCRFLRVPHSASEPLREQPIQVQPGGQPTGALGGSTGVAQDQVLGGQEGREAPPVALPRRSVVVLWWIDRP